MFMAIPPSCFIADKLYSMITLPSGVVTVNVIIPFELLNLLPMLLRVLKIPQRTRK